MANFMKVHGHGNLVKDPELRQTKNGKQICNFSVAVNYSNDPGQSDVSFFDCTSWDKNAEFVAKYFVKGSPIYLEGYLKQEKWRDEKTGKDRSKDRISVTAAEFWGRKADSSDSGNGNSRSSGNTYGNGGGYQQNRNGYGNGGGRGGMYGEGHKYSRDDAPRAMPSAPQPPQEEELGAFPTNGSAPGTELPF